MVLGMKMLRQEHERIVRMIEATEALGIRAERGEAVNREVLESIVEFFSCFAHGLHRDREEDVFIPLLWNRGMHEAAGCIRMMSAEHKEHDAAIADLHAAADAYSPDDRQTITDWVRTAFRYCQALRNHMRREDEVVFMAAERLLTEADHTELAKRFAKMEQEASAAGAQARIAACEARVLAELAPH